MDPQALMQMLMAAQSGGGGLDSASVVQQLVSSSDDPTTRMLGTMLAQRQADAARADEEEEADEDEEDRDERLNEMLARLDKTQETLAKVYDDLGAARAQNQLLAEALGACPRCWGSDPQCAICAGEGRAGSVEPNPALFAKFVLPAIRRMSEVRRRNGGKIPLRPIPAKEPRSAHREDKEN